MAAPAEKSPSEDFIHHSLFILSRLEPDAAVKDAMPLIQHPHDALLAAMGVRNGKDNQVLFAQGHLGYHRAQVTGEPLDKLALKIAAHFEGKTAAGYLRTFSRSPAVLSNAPLRDQPLWLAEVAAALQKEPSKEVKALAAPWLAAHALYQSAGHKLTAAESELKTATKAVDDAKAGCLIGYARLRGQLNDRFPRKPKVVASYFPTQVRKASKTKATDAGPAPT